MRKARQTPATLAYDGSALEAVLGETISLFHCLKLAREQLHGLGETTAGKLGILRDLHRLGPQTVPHMARARPVSRQYIQTLVDQLAKEGHIAFSDNPAHKRSRLVCLTPQGKDCVESAMRREAQVLSRLQLDIPEPDLRAAAAVLNGVRAAFESSQWQEWHTTVRP